MSDSSTVRADELLAHTGFLRGLALSLVFDEGRADDVVQDAMIVALRGKPRYRSRLRAWLAGITRNLALKSLRTETRLARRERAAARPEALGDTADAAARLELHRRVVDAVQALPEPYRTTIVHRYFDGSSVAGIARATRTPVKTVETRLRRAHERLRAVLDESHDGDRRAWCLGLAALVPLRAEVVATKVAAAAATGVVMSSTKTVLIAAVVGGVAFFSAWSLKKPEDPAQRRAPSAEAARGVPAADYDKLRRELDAKTIALAAAENELASMRKAARDAAEAEAAEKTVEPAPEGRPSGPRFAFRGVNDLSEVDWDAIGRSMADMPPILQEFVQGLMEGKDLEELGSLIGKIQELNGPLLAEAFKISKSGFEGLGVNGAFTHPAVMANMFHAALSKAGKPLSEEQEQRVQEIGQRYADLEKARLAGYGDEAFRIEKLVDETTLKDKFFAEMFAVLGEDQAQRLRPNEIAGLTRVDIFDSALVFGEVASPMRFKDRESLTGEMARRVTSKLRLEAEHKAAVDAAVRRWSATMSDEFLDGGNLAGGPIPIMRRERIAQAAAYQAALLKDIAATVPLTEEQLKALRREVNVLVPYKQR